MQKKVLPISIILYLISFCSGRFVLIDTKELKLEKVELIIPVLLDLSFAVLVLFISFFIFKKTKIIASVFLLVINIFHISNMEYIYALNGVININDIHYLQDTEFIKGSLSLNFLMYTLILFLASILFFVTLHYLSKNQHCRYPSNKYLLITLVSFWGLQFVSTTSSWEKSNFILLSIMNSFNKQISLSADASIDYKKIYDDFYSYNKVVDGQQIPLGKEYSSKENVLLVVLEGIPGAYLEEVQKKNGFDYDTKINSFEKIYNHSVVIPNLITHNNQTIRGLYTILSGKYPKLDASTPKATEYSQSENKDDMLPSILRKQGYNTVFLQAAPLEFMSKEQFAMDAGFNTILGEDNFKYQYIEFGWGIDDKAFFEQSFEYLNELNNREKPWFTTMLTVGTHHPYAFPPELEKEFPGPKEAAVKYLDDSLSSFLDSLEKSGITEDTLILFTSDESHGVNGQPLGSNWGFLLAYDPNIDGPIINKGVYGQIDILPSILDYLGLSSELNGRSIFRNYEQERPIMFSTHYDGKIYYIKNKGIVYQVNSHGDLTQINYKNNLFEGDYQIEEIKNYKLRDKIMSYATALNNELSRNYSMDKIALQKSKKIPLENSKKLLISSGQYLTLPEDSMVNISFDYKIDDYSMVNSLVFDLTLNGEERLSTIKRSKEFEHVEHEFYNNKKVEKFSFDLFITPYLKGNENTNIKITNLEISFNNNSNEKLVSDFKKVANLSLNSNILPYFSFASSAYPTSNGNVQIKKIQNNSFLMFGPYMTIGSGKYYAEVTLSNFKSLSADDFSLILDVVSNLGENTIGEKEYSFREYDLKKEKIKLTIPFEIQHPSTNDLEIRLRGNSISGMIIEDVRILEVN
ncbi:hypothetical protein DRW41_06850 [Neobacillus piezotolerans]|uniref:Sulfatase N-terminal domain-containing protein n=1 Tax=Neobacillus piezotolerans TaxID=2259171 RepID=A0A3D8GSV5_9BACI|nr:LTA synthase family protein [Neobacillus piezotolerans]RDU37554.1 hypothetical protein DRW41_06850 [Neobacillus piezotolerans]